MNFRCDFFGGFPNGSQLPGVVSFKQGGIVNQDESLVGGVFSQASSSSGPDAAQAGRELGPVSA